MFNLKLSHLPGDPLWLVDAQFPDEPQPRRMLLSGLLADMRGQEDLYLSYIAKAEAGETILDLYNNLVVMQLYPDGRVVLYDLNDDSDTPTQTELTLAEAKQLILDWLDAKAKWRAEHGPLNERAATESRGPHSTES
jgi:hypothetical protein